MNHDHQFKDDKNTPTEAPAWAKKWWGMPIYVGMMIICIFTGGNISSVGE